MHAVGVKLGFVESFNSSGEPAAICWAMTTGGRLLMLVIVPLAEPPR